MWKAFNMGSEGGGGGADVGYLLYCEIRSGGPGRATWACCTREGDVGLLHQRGRRGLAAPARAAWACCTREVKW